MSSKISNINDYTLIEKGSVVNNIYFYPHYAMIKQKIRSKKNQICVLFELRREKEPHIYCLYTYLLDKEGNKVFYAYSLYLKEIERYKYIIINNKNDANHADVIKKEIIDFNTLNYDNFLTILSNNYELSKMIPDLKEALEEKAESLIKERKKATYIDIPSPKNYYQNVTGYLVDEIEQQVTNEDELNISQSILKNIKKNFEVVLHNKYQTNLAFTAIYATIIGKVKSIHLKETDILEAKDLKTDTNKTSISYQDLNYILNSFINNIDEQPPIKEDLNIVQERIEYILTSKKRLKEITNYIKVILIDDKYIDPTKRNRSINEKSLKELIIKGFANYTYRPLPRNEVLLYNEDNNVIDFVAIISLDMIIPLLKTYKLNTSEENKEYIEYLKTIENIIIKGQKKKTERTLPVSIITTIHLMLYNYYNINDKALLFDKGQFILKLDYNQGTYDIKVINRDTEKKHGKIYKLNQETTTNIKQALDKNEKQFNIALNKIIYDNIKNSLNTLNYHIIIDNLSNNDVLIKILKSSKENYFECTFNLGELLLIISSIKNIKDKPLKQETPEEQPIIEEDSPIEETSNKLSKEEKEYIIRKSNTIVTIMNTKPIDNKNYLKVVELYQKLNEVSKEEQEEILKELKKLI
ncbi:MAG: hypothetical protein ACI4XM_07595 [Candidatus Coprovivens sp.]